MVLQRDSNGLAMRIKWFGNALRMVLQRESNGFAMRIEWFGNTDRMVLQHRSNGLATRIEHLCNTSNGLATRIKYLCNTHWMVCQRGLNTYATHIEWFGNTDRILLQHTSNNSAPEKDLRMHSQSSKYIAHAHSTLQPREPPTSYSNDIEKFLNGAPRIREGWRMSKRRGKTLLSCQCNL